MVPDLLKSEYDKIVEQIQPRLDMFRDKSILITGANGLIGSYLVNFLIYLNKNYDLNLKIFVLSRSKEKLSKCFNNEDVFIIEQDLNNPFSLNMDVDYIVHAASNSHPMAFSQDPVGTMKTNLIGTMSLLESSKNCGAKFLNISTGEIYGNNIDHNFQESDLGIVDTKLARSCYPESKRAAETLCMAYKEQFSVNINIARLCYVYGPTITETNSRADIQFLRKALNSENIVMKSLGQQRRTYCYVADAVCGILYIMLFGVDGEVYNIANAYSIVSVREYAETLANTANVKVVFENPSDTEAKGYSKQADSILDATKLQNLGWAPKFSLKEGIQHTYLIKKGLDHA